MIDEVPHSIRLGDRVRCLVPGCGRVSFRAAAAHSKSRRTFQFSAAGAVRPLITNEKTGRAYKERTLSKHVKWMLEDIGRTDLEPGWLRHTVMTTLEEAEVDGGPSAALDGHSPSGHAALKERHYRIRNPKLAKIATDKLIEQRRKR